VLSITQAAIDDFDRIATDDAANDGDAVSEGDLSDGADSNDAGDIIDAAIINMPTAELLALLAYRSDPAELIQGLIELIVGRVEAQMDAEEARASGDGRGESTRLSTPSSEEVDLVSLE
jgi:hypothetical protein